MNQRKVVVVYHNHALTPQLLSNIITELGNKLETPIIHTNSKLNIQVYPKKFFVSTFVLHFNVLTDRSLYIVFEDDITNFAFDRINYTLCHCNALAGPVSVLNTDDRQFTNMEYIADIDEIVNAIALKARSDFAIVPKAVCN